MRIPLLSCLLPLLAASLPLGAQTAISGASGLKLRQSEASRQQQAVRQSAVWWKAMQAAITEIHRHGAGGYSTTDAAHEALYSAFTWHEHTGHLLFNPAGARPSFCSGAVYAALLSALSRWDAAQASRSISPEAWKALAPQRVADGVGAWGWANANGPGFALLVHRLGAGVNFTDWEQARPADIAKFWWNDAIGGDERGHLVILVKDEGDKVCVWSSSQSSGEAAGGFGFRTYPKSAIRRVLFTRITRPGAFNRAPSIGQDEWLMQLTKDNVSWEDCARRCGVR